VGIGDHGHEHSEASQDADAGSDHEHGSSTDHCTHVHGPAFPGATKWEAAQVGIVFPDFWPIRSPGDHVPPPTHQPPRS
jgi:hypothetical protein